MAPSRSTSCAPARPGRPQSGSPGEHLASPHGAPWPLGWSCLPAGKANLTAGQARAAALAWGQDRPCPPAIGLTASGPWRRPSHRRRMTPSTAGTAVPTEGVTMRSKRITRTMVTALASVTIAGVAVAPSASGMPIDTPGTGSVQSAPAPPPSSIAASAADEYSAMRAAAAAPADAGTVAQTAAAEPVGAEGVDLGRRSPRSARPAPASSCSSRVRSCGAGPRPAATGRRAPEQHRPRRADAGGRPGPPTAGGRRTPHLVNTLIGDTRRRPRL